LRNRECPSTGTQHEREPERRRFEDAVLGARLGALGQRCASLRGVSGGAGEKDSFELSGQPTM
jgi:hypothetical protein